jgi:hypothetical protein
MEAAVVNKTKGKLAASLDTSKSIHQLIYCLGGGSGDMSVDSDRSSFPSSLRAYRPSLWDFQLRQGPPRGNDTLVLPTILPLPVNP